MRNCSRWELDKCTRNRVNPINIASMRVICPNGMAWKRLSGPSGLSSPQWHAITTSGSCPAPTGTNWPAGKAACTALLITSASGGVAPPGPTEPYSSKSPIYMAKVCGCPPATASAAGFTLEDTTTKARGSFASAATISPAAKHNAMRGFMPRNKAFASSNASAMQSTRRPHFASERVFGRTSD